MFSFLPDFGPALQSRDYVLVAMAFRRLDTDITSPVDLLRETTFLKSDQLESPVLHRYPPSHAATIHENEMLRTQERRPWSSCHHRARSACIASERVAPWSCTVCIPILTRPSWWSSPSCGRQASSDHRNRTAYDRNDAYPGRTGRPTIFVSMFHSSRMVLGRSYLAGLVLSHLVLSVLLAGLALAVGATSLGNVDLRNSALV
jgi:hypothetical protein